MPRVEQNGTMPTSLHYALTDSQCSKCGGQLEWKADFDDINQPKYTSQHCNQDYAIRIDAVKVETVTSRVRVKKEARGLEDEPRAIKMAKRLEEERRNKEEEFKK